MLHPNIEFHNAAALETIHGMPGVCPVRYPREVREQLNPRARVIGASSGGVELRFVCAGPNIRLAFAAHDSEVDLHVYRGGFGHSDHRIPAGATRIIHLTPPERFPLIDPEMLRAGAFSPDLWRIQIAHGTVSFLGVETYGDAIRPPTREETPKLRWLAFGSSITNSWGKGYPHQAARRLDVDVLNKGLSGSCHCEAAAAGFLAALPWDFATLELGVNMRVVYDPETFEKRVRGMLQTMRAAKPNAPLVLITHFLNLQHHPAPAQLTEKGREHQLAFDAILRTLVAEARDPRLTLIEGTEILPDLTGLGCDLLHPSDYGHIYMGENLAKALLPVIREIG